MIAQSIKEHEQANLEQANLDRMIAESIEMEKAETDRKQFAQARDQMRGSYPSRRNHHDARDDLFTETEYPCDQCGCVCKDRYEFMIHRSQHRHQFDDVWNARNTYDEKSNAVMMQNQKGAAFRKEFNELLSEFKYVIQSRIMTRMKDTTLRNVRHVKERYDRLLSEITEHQMEKSAAKWTGIYFRTEVQLLFNWSTLMCRMYIDLEEAGADTMHAQRKCEDFFPKITAAVARSHLVS